MSSKVVTIRPNQDSPDCHKQLLPTAQDTRKLASALVTALNIRPGTALILPLGNGSEASNFEAIESWVHAALIREQLPPGRLALQTLLPALESRLHTIAETLTQL